MLISNLRLENIHVSDDKVSEVTNKIIVQEIAVVELVNRVQKISMLARSRRSHAYS